MKIFKLIFKNLFRHKLRTFLTMLGISIAVMAYVLLRTVVTAWNYGVEASSVNRLITRHGVSFFYPLPISYKEKISQIDGVKNVTWANWFQGKFKDGKFADFFPRMGVDAETYFDVYGEYKVPKNQYEDFVKNRQGCIVGDKLAEQQKFKIGDVITMEGDIYPGHWEFVVSGIYSPKDPNDKTIDRTQMFFNWKYLDEQIKITQPGREGNVGWFIVSLNNPNASGKISKQIDEFFVNSTDGTKTETEKAFQQSFVSLSGAIITSLEVISYFIIGIILLVLVNTIVMTSRERIQEYAVLKTLGFSGTKIFNLIVGESILISLSGYLVGLMIAFPVVKFFGDMFPTMFPVFEVKQSTLIFSSIFSLMIGIVASLFPGIKSMKMKIVDGLRMIG